jgi:hypothetical protein
VAGKAQLLVPNTSNLIQVPFLCSEPSAASNADGAEAISLLGAQ